MTLWYTKIYQTRDGLSATLCRDHRHHTMGLRDRSAEDLPVADIETPPGPPS